MFAIEETYTAYRTAEHVLKAIHFKSGMSSILLSTNSVFLTLTRFQYIGKGTRCQINTIHS